MELSNGNASEEDINFAFDVVHQWKEKIAILGINKTTEKHNPYDAHAHTMHICDNTQKVQMV